MSKTPSIAFLTVGIILLVYGLNASSPISSTEMQAAAGTSADGGIWPIALGTLGILTGSYGLFFRKTP